MHELALCESVLQILEDGAVSQGYRQVKVVWLEIGSLAGVEVSALTFNFEAVTQGSLAEGAHLKIIEVPARACCAACKQNVVIKQRFDACPNCGSNQLNITEGEELRVSKLEVE